MNRNYIASIIDAIDIGIRQSLNEELSISTEVNHYVALLKKQILNDSHNRTSKNFPNKNITFKDGSFEFNLFDDLYTVNYTLYTCDINLCKPYMQASHVLTFSNTLNLYLALNSGQPYQKYFDNIIEHELLHIYQYNKSKKDVLSNSRIKKLYDIVKDIFNTSENEDLLTFASALYASFDFEQDAMVHSLYAQLMSASPGVNYKYILNHSDEYNYLYDMKFVIAHKYDICAVLDEYNFEQYGISRTYLFNTIEQSSKRFESKIGKIISKYLKTYELPHGSSIPQISHWRNKKEKN